MAGVPSNSVWQLMSYVPPRGPCNYRNGIMSGTCSCLRYMLHPVKAASSFECDGCGHHASFHSLANPSEDAILQKWSQAEQARIESAAATSSTGTQRNKRKRVTQQSESQVDQIVELTSDDGNVSTSTSARARILPR